MVLVGMAGAMGNAGRGRGMMGQQRYSPYAGAACGGKGAAYAGMKDMLAVYQKASLLLQGKGISAVGAGPALSSSL